MAGFEVVVRPAVFPNIRPVQARAPLAAPADDDPDKGVCVIRGSSGQTMDLSSSYSVNSSISKPVETERRFDTARVSQKKGGGGGEGEGEGEGEGRSARRSASPRVGPGGGTTEEENYVDIEVANRIKYRDGPQGNARVEFYDPVRPSDNVEILNRNQVRKAL